MLATQYERLQKCMLKAHRRLSIEQIKELYEKHQSLIERLPSGIFGEIAEKTAPEDFSKLCSSSRAWADWCAENRPALKARMEKRRAELVLPGFDPEWGMKNNFQRSQVKALMSDGQLVVPLFDVMGNTVEPGPAKLELIALTNNLLLIVTRSPYLIPVLYSGVTGRYIRPLSIEKATFDLVDQSIYKNTRVFESDGKWMGLMASSHVTTGNRPSLVFNYPTGVYKMTF